MQAPRFQIPETLDTERLTLCAPRVADAKEMREAIAESFDELHQWMEWATEVPTLEIEREIMASRRTAHERGEELSYVMRLKRDGRLAGCCGLPRLSWERRQFEIGYWVRTSLVGNGYVSECVVQLTRVCFERFEAKRVEICASEDNLRSCRVAELAGFRRERTIARDGSHPDGSLRDTAVYAADPPGEDEG